MVDRLNIWLENKKEVDGLNASNEGTGVTFGMNSTSDMTEEEFLEMQGFGAPNKPNNSDSSDSSSNGTGGGSRRLQQNLSIDWRAQNKVHEVKNQGSCGSCWAFAAATVQESMQAIKNDAPVVRLSEQEGVDCDQRSYGCSGGWMSYYWQMSAEIGSSSNEAY
jgi:C1A family cysteine protease